MSDETIDALLARVHERTGGLGVDIETFGETGAVEIAWHRKYPEHGISDERFATADGLEAALRAVLEREDEEDRMDEEER